MDPMYSRYGHLYETRTGILAPQRILWDDDNGDEGKENKEPANKEDDASGSGSADKASGTQEDETVDNEDDEQLGEKDTELVKHLKSKVNRTNRQNKNLRTTRDNLTKNLGLVTKERDTFKKERDDALKRLQELEGSQESTRLELQLSKAGVDEKLLSKAKVLLKEMGDAAYKEEEVEENGKKVKRKVFDVDKFREENSFLFGPQKAGSGSQSNKQGKTWTRQGGDTGSKQTAAPVAAVASKFKGPAKFRQQKGSE